MNKLDNRILWFSFLVLERNVSLKTEKFITLTNVKYKIRQRVIIADLPTRLTSKILNNTNYKFHAIFLAANSS